MIGCGLLIAGLGAISWLSLSGSGILSPAKWDKPLRPVPVVSTRGWYHDGKLKEGRDKYSFLIAGRIPGWEGGGLAPRDLVVVIHGFNNTAEKAVFKFATARDALQQNGFKGAVAGYSWDANTQQDPLAMTGYHEGKRNAAANGTNLAAFVVEYAKLNPKTRIHLVGYSMGARVALETLKALDEDPAFVSAGRPLASVQLAGAAVKADEVELGHPYGYPIVNRTAVLINYYSPEDNKLGYYFPLKEGGRALGVLDIEHPVNKPANYSSVNVVKELPKYTKTGKVDDDEYGDNHSGYLGTREGGGEVQGEGKLLDDGVMNLVAAYIAGLP